MGNPYKWLGWKREREVYKICLTHFNKLEEIIRMLYNLLNKFKDDERGSYRDLFHTIFDLEREADNIKDNIIKELSKGPFHPIDREDIMRLILSADDIASYAKAAARKLTYVDSKLVPSEIKSSMVKMCEMSMKEMNHLKLSLQYLIKDVNKAMDETNKVERLEEAIDEFREDLIAIILKWADQMNFVSHWLMVKEAVENIEQMADCMEDTADIIRGLSVSY
jgi:hypothetical protein